MCTSKAGFGIQDSRSAEAPNARHPASSILIELLAIRLGCQTTTTKSLVINPEKGVSLIELIMFIVIVSVSLAGILLVMNTVTKNSADPLVHKQVLAIAEALLEEVELMPFTFCDPNDVNAASAVSAADCSAGMDQNKGGAALTTPTPATENRWSATDPFDNVADYGGFMMNAGICDITNTTPTCTTPIAALNGYSAAVTVAAANFGGITAASGDALLITVAVTGPDNVPITLESYRTRYAPRAVP